MDTVGVRTDLPVVDQLKSGKSNGATCTELTNSTRLAPPCVSNLILQAIPKYLLNKISEPH